MHNLDYNKELKNYDKTIFYMQYWLAKNPGVIDVTHFIRLTSYNPRKLDFSTKENGRLLELYLQSELGNLVVNKKIRNLPGFDNLNDIEQSLVCLAVFVKGDEAYNFIRKNPGSGIGYIANEKYGLYGPNELKVLETFNLNNKYALNSTIKYIEQNYPFYANTLTSVYFIIQGSPYGVIDGDFIKAVNKAYDYVKRETTAKPKGKANFFGQITIEFYFDNFTAICDQYHLKKEGKKLSSAQKKFINILKNDYKIEFLKLISRFEYDPDNSYVEPLKQAISSENKAVINDDVQELISLNVKDKDVKTVSDQSTNNELSFYNIMFKFNDIEIDKAEGNKKFADAHCHLNKIFSEFAKVYSYSTNPEKNEILNETLDMFKQELDVNHAIRMIEQQNNKLREPVNN